MTDRQSYTPIDRQSYTQYRSNTLFIQPEVDNNLHKFDVCASP